jgi:peptidoglycan/LPS O-acetylase OafA/YrhL
MRTRSFSTPCDSGEEGREADPASAASAEGGIAPTTRRFAFIDALRGLAALSVAVYHIERYGPLGEPAATVIPWPLRRIIEHGWVGVQVFFVISGFVIAYSVRKAWVTPAYLGNFALRRSLRLDPPYWFTIFCALSLDALAISVLSLPSLMDERPQWRQCLAHFFYVQNILEFENISAGFWTLCIEMQFYLLFVLLTGVAQRVPGGGTGMKSTTYGLKLTAVFTPLALLSLFYFHFDSRNDAWIVHFFCMFFFGALAWWALDGRVPRGLFWAFAGAMLIRLGLEWALDIAVALIAGATIYVIGRLRRLQAWGAARPLQHLGKISYSLYLIHYPVSHLVVNVGYELTGDAPVAAVAWIAAALLLSLLAAHLLHVLIEAPSTRLAARLKERPALCAA